MEVVSKLFKTQLKVIKIKREDDKLMLLGDPKDPMSANSSMTAKDVGDMAGLALSWDVLLWAILFPFYYAGSLLKDRDLDQKIFTGAYIIGTIFITLLLLASYTYLETYPFLSAAVFFFFTGAFFATYYVSKRYGFLYPAAVLLVVAYYLCLAGVGASSLQFPVFSLSILALVVVGCSYLDKLDKEEISNVLRWTGFTVVFYFLTAIFYKMYTTSDYLRTVGWVAVASIAGFAVYYGVRAWQDKREFLSYVALFLLTLAILVELSLLQLSTAVQGTIVFHVGISYALVGTVLRRVWPFGLVRPYYVLGLVIPAASFLTFYNLPDAFTYGLLIFAAAAQVVSEWTRKRHQEDDDNDEDEPDPAHWFKKAYQYTGNTLGYAALVFYVLTRFPISTPVSWAALFTAFAYLYTALRNEGSFIQTRNQYLYLFAMFTALFLYPLLWIANPFKVESFSMVVSAVPMGILLYLGALFARTGNEAKANTANESVNIFIFLSLALPFFGERYSPIAALTVTGAFIAIIGGAFFAAYHRSLHYAPVLLAASVLFNLFYSITSSYLVIGSCFVLFGIAGMALALAAYPNKQVWSNALLFAWIVGAGISLSLFSMYKQVFIYSGVVWAMTFAIGGLYLQGPEKAAAD